MKRFVEDEDRKQATLLPACLDDYVTEDNPVRVIDVFIDELDLEALGFAGVVPEVTGRPAYHPATLLKVYLYGYLNRIQSSRRLERESQRNIELMWLTGRLMPDFKTIADFRRDNGPAIRAACAQFVVLCRNLNLFTRAVVALDGSRFKAVNNRDKNFTVAKVAKRIEQVEASIARQANEFTKICSRLVLVAHCFSRLSGPVEAAHALRRVIMEASYSFSAEAASPSSSKRSASNSRIGYNLFSIATCFSLLSSRSAAERISLTASLGYLVHARANPVRREFVRLPARTNTRRRP